MEYFYNNQFISWYPGVNFTLFLQRIKTCFIFLIQFLIIPSLSKLISVNIKSTNLHSDINKIKIICKSFSKLFHSYWNRLDKKALGKLIDTVYVLTVTHTIVYTPQFSEKNRTISVNQTILLGSFFNNFFCWIQKTPNFFN